MQRPLVVPRSLLPSVTTRRTLMGLIGSDTRLLVVTWSKLPAERPVSRMSRPGVLLSLVRAPAQPPQHAYFGSRSHTPSSRCLRFERRVAATPPRLPPVLLARLWTDQTSTANLASASPIAPRTKLSSSALCLPLSVIGADRRGIVTSHLRPRFNPPTIPHTAPTSIPPTENESPLPLR